MTNAPSSGIIGVSRPKYAPQSWRMFASNAVIVPSDVAAIRTWSIWARPWWETAIASERVSIHLIGRPSSLDGPCAQRLLGADLELAAEAAADLGRDDAHVVLGDAHLHGVEQAQQVRDLRRGPDGQVAGAVLGDDAARLDRRARGAVVDDPLLDDDVGLGDRRVDVAAAHRPLVRLVRAERLVDEDLVLQRLLHVDDGRQRLVLDAHGLRGVDDVVLVLGDDHRDGVADVLDLAAGERPAHRGLDLDAGRRPRHRQRGERGRSCPRR